MKQIHIFIITKSGNCHMVKSDRYQLCDNLNKFHHSSHVAKLFTVIWSELEKSVVIYNVCTKSSFRNQGYMRKLFSYVECKLKQEGVEILYLDCKNELIPFYQKLGFCKCNKEYYLDCWNEPLHDMIKKLI